MAVHVDCKMAYETTLDGDGIVEMSCKLHSRCLYAGN